MFILYKGYILKIKGFPIPNNNYKKYSVSNIESKNIFCNFKNKIKKMYLNFTFCHGFHSVFLIVVHLERSVFFNICKIG